MCSHLGSSSQPPKVNAVLHNSSFVKRVAVRLLQVSRRYSCSDPKVLVPMRVHHFICGQIHCNEPGLVQNEHEHPRCSESLHDHYECEQWVASDHSQHPTPKRLVCNERMCHGPTQV